MNAKTFEAPKKGRMTLSQVKDTLTAKDRNTFENMYWSSWEEQGPRADHEIQYLRITDRLKKNGFKKSRRHGMEGITDSLVKKIGPSAWNKFYNKWLTVGKSNFAYFGYPYLIYDTMLSWKEYLFPVEIWTKDNKIVLLWQFIHHDHEDFSPWFEQTFTISTKPAAKKTTTRKSKPKAKTGRKAPIISATKRKVGTRMRGNDGKMWQVKKSGKSQRWMAGAETFEGHHGYHAETLMCPICDSVCDHDSQNLYDCSSCEIMWVQDEDGGFDFLEAESIPAGVGVIFK